MMHNYGAMHARIRSMRCNTLEIGHVINPTYGKLRVITINYEITEFYDRNRGLPLVTICHYLSLSICHQSDHLSLE